MLFRSNPSKNEEYNKVKRQPEIKGTYRLNNEKITKLLEGTVAKWEANRQVPINRSSNIVPSVIKNNTIRKKREDLRS